MFAATLRLPTQSSVRSPNTAAKNCSAKITELLTPVITQRNSLEICGEPSQMDAFGLERLRIERKTAHFIGWTPSSFPYSMSQENHISMCPSATTSQPENLRKRK